MAGPWCSLVSTSACQAGGRGFKSRRARHDPQRQGSSAVEHRTENPGVRGSTPRPGTNLKTNRTYAVGAIFVGADDSLPENILCKVLKPSLRAA